MCVIFNSDSRKTSSALTYINLYDYSHTHTHARHNSIKLLYNSSSRSEYFEYLVKKKKKFILRRNVTCNGMTENGRTFFNGKHVLRTRMMYYYIIISSSEAKMDNKIDRRPVVAIRSRRFIRFLCCRHRTRHMCNVCACHEFREIGQKQRTTRKQRWAAASPPKGKNLY